VRERIHSNGQGQGGGTARKEDGFAALFHISLGMSKAPPVANHPYHHLDLNSGCGWNYKGNCDGSPVVFLREAVAACRPGTIQVYFCDIDAESIRKLHGACSPYTPLLNGSVHAAAMDNGAFLKRVTSMIVEEERKPEYAIGSCVCDPNGWKQGFPIGGLEEFFLRFPRIDFILHLNFSVLAMVRGCKKSPSESQSKGFRQWPEVQQLLDRFHKQEWFIRNPSSCNGMRFTTLVGRNRKTRRSPFKEFFPLDSRQGREIVTFLRRVNPEQGSLFEGME
jgi:hypothetical protein